MAPSSQIGKIVLELALAGQFRLPHAGGPLQRNQVNLIRRWQYRHSQRPIEFHNYRLGQLLARNVGHGCDPLRRVGLGMRDDDVLTP